MADTELRQAFANLQKKTLETRSQVKVADAQIGQLEREKARSKLTTAEIANLPDETRLFESCGRMFILRSQDEIQEMLRNVQSNSDKKVKDLEAKKIYLEKSVKESEENLREMVAQRRK